MKKFLPLCFVFVLLFTDVSAVVIAATPTPWATETIQPSVTAEIPSFCEATSIIPTSGSFPTADLSTPTPCPTDDGVHHQPCGVEGHPGATSTPTGTPVTPSPTSSTSGLLQLVDLGNSLCMKHGANCRNDLGGTSPAVGGSATDIYLWFDVVDSTASTHTVAGETIEFRVKNVSGVAGDLYYLGEWFTDTPFSWYSGWSLSQPANGAFATNNVNFPSSGLYSWNTNLGVMADASVSGLRQTVNGASGYSIPTSGLYHHYLRLHLALHPLSVVTTPTPTTPTVTPAPCGNGVNNGAGVVPSSPIATFNSPHIVSSVCGVVFNPISLPVPVPSWVPFDLPSEVSFPGWRVCFDLVEMSAMFAGVEWVGVIGTIVTFIAIGGIYKVLRDQ